MLETVDVGRQPIALYESSVGGETIAQLQELAEPLRGARVLHVNATPYGGGVAEILRSEMPLLRDLGLVADWKLITGDESFFSVTKAMHNGLQGATRELTPAEQETYVTHSARNAQLLEERYDLIVVHDPQPLALLDLHGKDDARWIWRCHIDTAEPNVQIWGFLRPYLEGYDAAVFTLGSFAPPDVPVGRVEIIPPAIDPESPKNIRLERRAAQSLLAWIGVDIKRPLVSQVSRFDPWK
ncbi:MAG TPA: glycosyl transferase family 1, partial [Rubrobacter sp.]|nr:glycosyl transferase family 1 [Rubrobacter sp.]